MARDYEDEQDSGLEPQPVALAHWLEDQYVGDDRFESIEINEPGPGEGESLRVRFVCNKETHFFVGIYEDDGLIRIGLATASEELNKEIEDAANESGDSLTEFVEIAMDAEDELEHEVAQFHDDVFYFASDIPYNREEDLAASGTRDEIIYYLDGMMTAFNEFVEKS